MRFPGTCSRYSNNAMPQLTSAATHQGFAGSSFRCAYQAKVMKMFDMNNRPAAAAIGGNCMSGDPFHVLGAAGSQQFARGAAPGDDDVRRDFGQRLEHEGALVHARMGHG